jgi:WS/DGAT/MGAT family acyltransferase
MSDAIRFEHRMSDADALMWSIEKDPLLRSTITAISLLDRAPDRARLEDKLERGTRLIPRLRQRVVGNPYSLAPPRWEVDPSFDLRYHVRTTRAAGDGSLRSLLDIAEPIAMQGFDRARPLWEFVVVEGLADGQAALIQKIHHSITDGVGGVRLAMMLLDLERDPEGPDEPMPDAPPVHVMSSMERLVDAVTHVQRRQMGIARRSSGTIARGVSGVLADPFTAARDLAAAASSVGRMLAPATTPLSPIMTGRSLSVHFDTITVPLPELKAASKRAEGKLNDAFVAAVAGGLKRYHDHHGVSVEALRMSMPINIRSGENEDLAGNQFAPARFAVPMTEDDPIDRMRMVRALVAQQRGEPALALTEPLAQVLNRLPTTLTTGVFGSMLRGIDFVTSNVPGAPIPVFLGGAKLLAQFPFGPMAGSATNITLMSYQDEIHVGVNVDPAAVPDVDLFHRCLVEGFDEIRKVA